MMSLLTSNLTETVAADNNVALSDDALVAKARGLNKTMERHVTKGIEAFWDLGEALAQLFKRRHLQENGKWADVLKRINVSTTTDSQARRFFAACCREDVGQYKNKTAALRAMSIIANPEASKTSQSEDGDKGNENEGDKEIGNESKPAKADARSKAIEDDRDGNEAGNVGEDGVGRPDVDGDVETLQRLATRLESLAEKNIVITADHGVHLDRILAAVARLREGVDVAA